MTEKISKLAIVSETKIFSELKIGILGAWDENLLGEGNRPRKDIIYWRGNTWSKERQRERRRRRTCPRSPAGEVGWPGRMTLWIFKKETGEYVMHYLKKKEDLNGDWDQAVSHWRKELVQDLLVSQADMPEAGTSAVGVDVSKERGNKEIESEGYRRCGMK